MNDLTTASAAVTQFIKEHEDAVGYLIPAVGASETRPVLVRVVDGNLAKMTDCAAGLCSHNAPDQIWQSQPVEVTDCGTGPKTVGTSQLIEIRLFDQEAELHWLSVQGSGKGTSAIRDKTTATKQDFLPLGKPTRQLLWGQISDTSVADWVRLSDARIGSFWAPITQGKPPNPLGDQTWFAAFQSQEYLQQDSHGNWFVADQRYLGIAALPQSKVELRLRHEGEE